MSSPEETRAYQRGYRAGRLRTEAEMEKSRLEWEASCAAIQQQRVMVFCDALQGMLASPRTWHTGEKRWSTVQEYVAGARDFANEAERLRVIR